MKRILISLTDTHAVGLAKLKKTYGTSVNQLVRFAIAYLLEHHPSVAKAYPFMEEKRDENKSAR